MTTAAVPTTKEASNTIVRTEELEWEPWSKYFPGAPEAEGPYGGWLKVLRRPSEQYKGWTFLFKWVHGWPGKTVKHVALVPPDGDEHIYMLNHSSKDLPYADMEGVYTYRGPNARHGGNFGEDFMALITYSGSPDIIVSHTFLDVE